MSTFERNKLFKGKSNGKGVNKRKLYLNSAYLNEEPLFCNTVF